MFEQDKKNIVDELALIVYAPWAKAKSVLIKKIKRFSEKLLKINYALAVLSYLFLVWSYLSPNHMNIALVILGTFIMGGLTIFNTRLSKAIDFYNDNKAIDLCRSILKKDVQQYRKDIDIFLKPLFEPGAKEKLDEYLIFIYQSSDVEKEDRKKAFTILDTFQNGIKNKNTDMIYEGLEMFFIFHPKFKEQVYSFEKNLKLTVLEPVIDESEIIEKEISIGEALPLQSYRLTSNNKVED